MTEHLVYSGKYDLYLPLFEHLHPFDGRKFSRAYGLLRERLGPAIENLTHTPDHDVPASELLRVHTPSYLSSLNSAEVVAKALEIQAVRLVPAVLREQRILTPMRYAVQGTIDAVELALRQGFVFHLGGGFHHAFADHGEGFCLYADAAIAIHSARARQLIGQTETVLIIDLDAHRGNGCEHIFSGDSSIRFFDIYNFQVYPGPLDADEEEAPYIIPIKSQTADHDYLETLTAELPRFLSENGEARLAIYNAGTDILAGDPLGQLAVSEAAVLQRDRFVLGLLAERGIPTVVLTSGGYTAHSHILIAQSAGDLLERFAQSRSAI
ncbi:MAG TPA: histone deacetylase [Bryobacteraceae bacterium]|jgi:histone deacetylase 11|nr:histone deacetylase [Bryobacteraceae bacterium]